jgi:hypothetical protein
MLAIISTWVGTVLGLGVLVAAAIGAVAIDFGDAFRGREKKAPQAEPTEPTAAPLN